MTAPLLTGGIETTSLDSSCGSHFLLSPGGSPTCGSSTTTSTAVRELSIVFGLASLAVTVRGAEPTW
jgi:hypothetical protein